MWLKIVEFLIKGCWKMTWWYVILGLNLEWNHLVLVKGLGGFVLSFTRTSNSYIYTLKVMSGEWEINLQISPIEYMNLKKFASIPHRKNTVVLSAHWTYIRGLPPLFYTSKSETLSSLSEDSLQKCSSKSDRA